MDLSIIIPVYNGERYLRRCLLSVFTQEFSGMFEVIAVNDGSTDASLEILQAYQEKEPRLKIITHQENKKLSIARSTGINASSGEYVMHVDADDWLLPGALEGIFKTCKASDADVVVFNYVREDGEGNRIYRKRIKKEFTTRDKLSVQKYFYGSCWNKIVKRRVLENMAYAETGITMGEDLVYATEVLLKADTICLSPASYYVYFDNSGSVTRIAGDPQERLWNAMLLLERTNVIIAANKAPERVAGNVADYIEQLLYETFAYIAFVDHGVVREKERLMAMFSCFGTIAAKRSHRLSRALDHKLFCIMQVVRYSGFRHALGIIRLSLKTGFIKYGSLLLSYS